MLYLTGCIFTKVNLPFTKKRIVWVFTLANSQTSIADQKPMNQFKSLFLILLLLASCMPKEQPAEILGIVKEDPQYRFESRGQMILYAEEAVTRGEAEEDLGDKFDIKKFHDLLLKDGTIHMVMMRDIVERWIEEERL